MLINTPIQTYIAALYPRGTKLRMPLSIAVDSEETIWMPEGGWVIHKGRLIALSDPDLLNPPEVEETIMRVFSHLIILPEARIWNIRIYPDIKPTLVHLDGREFLSPYIDFVVNSIRGPERSP